MQQVSVQKPPPNKRVRKRKKQNRKGEHSPIKCLRDFLEHSDFPTIDFERELSYAGLKTDRLNELFALYSDLSPSVGSVDRDRVLIGNIAGLVHHQIYLKLSSKIQHIIDGLPDEERAKFRHRLNTILYDGWVNYPEDMKAHIDAAEKVLWSGWHGSSLADTFQTTGKIKILDPSVGDGSVLLRFLNIIKKSNPDLQFEIFINDSSKRMCNTASQRLSFSELKDSLLVTQSYHNMVDILISDVLSSDPSFSDMDVVLLSQTLDVIKGCNAKRRMLEQVALNTLALNGYLVVVGEDPALFNIRGDIHLIDAVLFEPNFHGLDFDHTDHEVRSIGNNAFHRLFQATSDIDGHHSMFCAVYEKRRESKNGTKNHQTSGQTSLNLGH
ncbi:hypothetical protein JXB01_03850 [Candidatus Micrarchaeota archaeon]|nr:hypothetical protein [Candidatus Micrarchaeota archaeon]